MKKAPSVNLKAVLRTAGVIALAVVFGVGMSACYLASTPLPGGGSNEEEEDDGDDLVWTVIFDMQDSDNGTVSHGIQELTPGKVTIGNDLPAGTASSIKPLVEAGNGDSHVIITAVEIDGKIALQYEAKADWGAGIDLRNAAFGFLVGDKITITGEVLDIGTAGYIQPNFRVGAEQGHGFKETEAGEFEWEIELDASMLADIKAGDPAGIRIDGRGGSGGAVPTGQKVVLTQILIEGDRPSTLTKLAAPTVTASGNIVSWNAIEGASGYEVFAGSTKIATQSTTTLNLLNVATLADGTYAITVVAVGTAGSTSNSDPSAPVNATKTTPPPPSFDLTVDGSTKTVVVNPVKGEVVAITGGYTFTNTIEGSNIDYGNAYATFGPVDIGTGKTLNDVDTIVFTWVGISGDIGWKTNGIRLIVSSSPISGYQSSGGNFANNETIPAAGVGTTLTNLTFTIKTGDAAVTAITGNSLYFAIYVHAEAKDSSDNPTAYSIKDVAFTLK